MKNKSKLAIFLMVLVFFLIIWVANKIDKISASTFILYLLVYLLFCIVIYMKIRSYENFKNYLMVSSYLCNSYVEVIPVRPKLLAIKYGFNRKEPIKAYARLILNETIHISLITSNKEYKISTNNWTWFYRNFAEKEPE